MIIVSRWSLTRRYMEWSTGEAINFENYQGHLAFGPEGRVCSVACLKIDSDGVA